MDVESIGEGEVEEFEDVLSEEEEMCVEQEREAEALTSTPINENKYNFDVAVALASCCWR